MTLEKKQFMSGRLDLVQTLYSCKYWLLALMLFGWQLTGTFACAQVPATNVLVEVVNGNLRVTGQANSVQSIKLSRGNYPGQYKFESGDIPDSVTFFNNLPSLVVDGVVGDMTFDLKAGVKTLTIGDVDLEDTCTVPGNLIVKSPTNSSANLFFLNLDVKGQTKIALSGGRDRVGFFKGIFRERVQIKTGKGSDEVFFQSIRNVPVIVSDDVEIDTGSGADEVYLTSLVSIGNCDIKLGSENDLLLFFESELVTVNVVGMRGLDQVEVDEFSTFLDLNVKSIELLSFFDP